ncbi:MAG: hypothetical protein DRJ05_20230 [Bacteroidetes bacterium]|nr:MAG: hypothetical protein DRJ05_20230 [Bacteroidota bacterium]
MIHKLKISLVVLFPFFWLGLIGQDKNILVLPDTTYVIADPGLELLIAANEGDTVKVSALLELGVDVDYSNSDGVTSLMFAAEAGRLDVVLILLHHGAKVNVLPYNEVDALLGACIAGHVFVSDTLIQNGASVNTSNYFGVTPLMYAAAYDDYTMADMLLFYDAIVDKKDGSGNTALMYSVFYGNSDIVTLLTERGAKVTAKDKDGFTALMVAAQNGHLDEVVYLLENGADINAQNDKNLTALSLAIINNQINVVEYLLGKGADSDHDISNVQNQYTLAREYNAKDIKTMLLDSGATKNTKPDIGSLVLGFNMTAAKNDFMMGLHVGVNELKYGLGLKLTYKTRPYTRSVLYPVDEQVSYQLWEKRSVISLGADKRFVLGRSSVNSFGGFFGGIDFAYTYGNFRGSDKKPDDSFHVVPKVGAFWSFKAICFGMNYEYFPLKNSKSSPHRINVSLGYKFNLQKNKIQLKTEPML